MIMTMAAVEETAPEVDVSCARTCSCCRRVLTTEDFYSRPGSPDGLRRDCKDCVKSRVQKSPSKVARQDAAAERKAQRSPFDPAAYKRQWHQDNQARLAVERRTWAQEHQTEMRAYRSKWAKANPEKGRQSEARHRARRLSRSYEVTPKDWARLVSRYSGLCAYCARSPWGHMDHVVPVSRGGQHAIGNLLPACAACNQEKGARTLVEWRYSNSRRKAC